MGVFKNCQKPYWLNHFWIKICALKENLGCLVLVMARYMDYEIIFICIHASNRGWDDIVLFANLKYNHHYKKKIILV